MVTPYSGKTILVVEDDPATRRAMKLYLESAGCRVALAEHGGEALQTLRSGLRPDLILLDLTMPVLDGWEFRKQQQQDPALADIPVVIVSGTDGFADRNTQLNARAALTKPVELDQLLAIIRQATAAGPSGVLVVDDEIHICKLLEMALQAQGISVWSAASGPEALALLEERREEISVALLDVQMPRMDGPATLSALRQIKPDLLSCFMSGHSGKYQAQDLLALGASGVFHKPFSLEDVTRTLRKLLQPLP